MIKYLLRVFLAMPLVFLSVAAMGTSIIYVDSERGDDAHDGLTADTALRSLRRAGEIVPTSGTIRVIPRQTPFRENLVLRGRGGTKERPLTVEGNGAVIDLGTDITEGPWERQGDEWILQLQTKEHTRPIQTSPIFVNNTPLWIPHPSKSHNPAKGVLRLTEDGSFAVTFPSGLTPENSRVIMTSADGESGVRLHANGSHIVIRDLTVRYAGNDGFNVHGSGKNIIFKNVRALMCGDQGISSHGTAEVEVHGAEIAFCGSRAGGIADIQQALTTYRNILIHGNRNPRVHLHGAQHLIDGWVGFDNSALPRVSETVSIENAVVLDPEGNILRSTPGTNMEALELLLRAAKEAREKIDIVPYPGVNKALYIPQP